MQKNVKCILEILTEICIVFNVRPIIFLRDSEKETAHFHYSWAKKMHVKEFSTHQKIIWTWRKKMWSKVYGFFFLVALLSCCPLSFRLYEIAAHISSFLLDVAIKPFWIFSWHMCHSRKISVSPAPLKMEKDFDVFHNGLTQQWHQYKKWVSISLFCVQRES